MKVLCLSDLHGYLPKDSPRDVDAVIIAGDVCPDFTWNPVANADIQRAWLAAEFSEWLRVRYPEIPVLLTWGNHDRVGEQFSVTSLLEGIDRPNLRILVDEVTALTDLVDGREFTVYGTPWSCEYGTWAFMKPDEDLARYYANIPANLDILITHGPPKFHGDRNLSGISCGSESLAFALLNKMPKYVITGHIHEARGAYRFNGGSWVYNVSYLTAGMNRFVPNAGDVEPLYRTLTL